MGLRARDGGKSEGQLVMSWIGVQTWPHIERWPTSDWSLLTRQLDQPSQRESRCVSNGCI